MRGERGGAKKDIFLQNLAWVHDTRPDRRPAISHYDAHFWAKNLPQN